MRLSILFILITVFLDAMGISLIMPVMPDLIQSVHGGDLGSAAIWGGILTASFAAMQFLFGPFIGNLSDSYGRRPILLLALFVMSLDYLVMAVAGTIWLLLVGRIFGGMTAATHSTAAAYIADISKPEEKAANFGLNGAAIGLGFVFGPVIGGFLAGFDIRAPFYAAAIFAFANMLFGMFVLPETVTDKIRRPFHISRANPLASFKAIGSLPGIGRMLAIVFIFGLAHFVYPAIWAFFGKERFGWNPAMIGLSLAIFGISMALVQAVLVRPFIRWFGERNTVIIGFLIDVLALILIATIPSGAWVMALTPIAALGSVSGPALQGIMSKATPDNQQGELQGVLQSSNAVAMAMSPLLMTWIFWAFTSGGWGYFPGAPFTLSAALILLCVVLFQRNGAAAKTAAE